MRVRLGREEEGGGASVRGSGRRARRGASQ